MGLCRLGTQACRSNLAWPTPMAEHNWRTLQRSHVSHSRPMDPAQSGASRRLSALRSSSSTGSAARGKRGDGGYLNTSQVARLPRLREAMDASVYPDSIPSLSKTLIVLALSAVGFVFTFIFGSILCWVCLELCWLLGYGAWSIIRSACWCRGGQRDVEFSDYP
jgi:hypothetical protein